MTRDRASEFYEVFEYFGVGEHDRPVESCYAYAPVFRCVVEGVSVAIKRTRNPVAAAAIMRWLRAMTSAGVPVVTPVAISVDNPAVIGNQTWVAYRWIEGRPYDGSHIDIAAAGELLGRMHRLLDYADPDMPSFEWPNHDVGEVETEIANRRRVIATRAPEIVDEVCTRTEAWHRSFMAETLPAIRDAGLPTVVASTDFKANNLVYTDMGPVLIDPDNADRLPRIIDLAMAAVLFHNESASAPARMFTDTEWCIFARAYATQVRPTELERALWPTAIRYIATEWGTWTLIDADDCDDWSDPRKRRFLSDLAAVDPERFAIKEL